MWERGPKRVNMVKTIQYLKRYQLKHNRKRTNNPSTSMIPMDITYKNNEN